MNITRRGFLGVTAAGGLLHAQDGGGGRGQRPIFRVEVGLVVHSFQVTDSKGRYVNGLKPGAPVRVAEGDAEVFGQPLCDGGLEGELGHGLEHRRLVHFLEAAQHGAKIVGSDGNHRRQPDG